MTVLCGSLISSMRPAVFFAEEVTVRPTVLNSLLLFFLGFTSGLKITPLSAGIGVYNIILLIDGCAVLSEWEWDAQLQKYKINMWRSMLILWRMATNKLLCGKHWMYFCYMYRYSTKHSTSKTELSLSMPNDHNQSLQLLMHLLSHQIRDSWKKHETFRVCSWWPKL